MKLLKYGCQVSPYIIFKYVIKMNIYKHEICLIVSKYFSIKVICSGKDYIDKDVSVTICSYDLLTKKLDELVAMNYKTIIFDESHLVKSIIICRFFLLK